MKWKFPLFVSTGLFHTGCHCIKLTLQETILTYCKHNYVNVQRYLILLEKKFKILTFTGFFFFSQCTTTYTYNSSNIVLSIFVRTTITSFIQYVSCTYSHKCWFGYVFLEFILLGDLQYSAHHHVEASLSPVVFLLSGQSLCLQSLLLLLLFTLLRSQEFLHFHLKGKKYIWY